MKLVTKKKYKKALKVVAKYESQNIELYPVTICVPASGCGTMPSREIKTYGKRWK
jgi:hypothetical protein